MRFLPPVPGLGDVQAQTLEIAVADAVLGKQQPADALKDAAGQGDQADGGEPEEVRRPDRMSTLRRHRRHGAPAPGGRTTRADAPRPARTRRPGAALTPWLFLAPYLVLFVAFVVAPAVYGLWISLHD